MASFPSSDCCETIERDTTNSTISGTENQLLFNRNNHIF